MINTVTAFWRDYLRPVLQRPRRVQLAALCHRGDGAGREVLLVSSRDTGRWILPKGWPMTGKSSGETVLQEAWEEAGVSDGLVAPAPLGSYRYQKRLQTGWSVPVETTVYPVLVRRLSNSFPEAHQRQRIWVTPMDAAERVDEPDLAALLRAFGSQRPE